MPQTILPDTSCAMFVAAHWTTAPIDPIATPLKIVFLRPSSFPTKNAIALPIVPPMLYIALIVANKVGEGW